MSLKTDIDQLAADVALAHRWAHGDGIVATEGGVVRTPSKLIADKSNEIDLAAQGVLTQSIAQAQAAATSAAAAQTARDEAETARGGAAAAWSAALAANPDLNPWGRMNPSTLQADFTLAAGYNAVSAGPLTVGEGVAGTLDDGSNWTII